MRRKIDDKLKKWIRESDERFNKNIHKCLLIKGLRQVGKSYSIREAIGLPNDNPSVIYIDKDFEGIGACTCVEVNLSLNSSFIEAFKNTSDAQSVLKFLSQNPLLSSCDFSLSDKHHVILFIDEVQESSEALKTLKFLSFQKNLIVIASDSLLGVSIKGDDLFPTGYVDIIRMFPFDFEEYLWAHGFKESYISSFVSSLKNNEPIVSDLHEKLMSLYREYIVSGGLPSNVKIAVEEGIHSPSLFLNQRSLLLGYESDIAKYAPKGKKIKAQLVFETIPNALARTNTRFTYSLLGKGTSRSRYEESLDWLIKAGLIYKVCNLEEPLRPLKAKSIPDDFKLYLADEGILWAMIGNQNVDNILNPESEFQKGMIYENGTADVLEMSNVFDERDVFYFERNSTLEVDFLIETKNMALVVEAKSSLNTKSKSLSTLMKEYKTLKAVKVSPKNTGRSDNLYSLPHYALPFIDKIVD